MIPPIILRILQNEGFEIEWIAPEDDGWWVTGRHEGIDMGLGFGQLESLTHRDRWWLTSASESLPDNGLWERIQKALDTP